MSQAHILVIDDEPDILELVQYNLSHHGYQVSCAQSGEEALLQLGSEPPDLVVLDLMLPGLDGMEICKVLKRNARTAAIPIIILTARDEESDVVTGLELGADDYLTKPFSPRVLMARIKAVLRRPHTPPAEADEVVTYRGITIHTGRHEVSIQGQILQLTSTEFRILCLFARRPGWVFSRQQIIEAAPGHDANVTDRSVDVHMVSLRRKLGVYGDRIETIRGAGYRLKEEEG